MKVITRQLPVFIGFALSVLLFTHCVSGEAQQPKKVSLVGILTPDPLSARANLFEAFRIGLRERGYVEGQNIAVEIRSAEGKPDRLPTLARELVSLKVDVIVAATTPATEATKQASRTIPMVTISADPVGSGLVASLARPRGNVTGLSIVATEMTGKQLELLKEAFPKVKRVAFVKTPANPGLFDEAKVAAQALGLQIQSMEVQNLNELEAFLKSAISKHADALVVSNAVSSAYRGQIVDFAAKNRLPVMYGESESVEVGGLMSYGPNRPDLYRRAATFVDKILKGVKPADLPVEQSTKFELVVSLTAAKEIGVTFPQKVLTRADRVIK